MHSINKYWENWMGDINEVIYTTRNALDQQATPENDEILQILKNQEVILKALYWIIYEVTTK